MTLTRAGSELKDVKETELLLGCEGDSKVPVRGRRVDE